MQRFSINLITIYNYSNKIRMKNLLLAFAFLGGGMSAYAQNSTEPILTLKGTVGEKVTLGLGVYDNFDIYSVDFGDGTLLTDTVCYQNGGLKGEDGKAKEGTTHTGITKFTGTVAGDGTIKVYGESDIWYLSLDKGTLPTSLNQEKMKKVVQFTISGAEVETLDLTGLDDLKQFSFSQGSIEAINVSNNINLTNLTINNNTASKFDSKLAKLDVSKNVNLEQLNVMGASVGKPGLLQTLDLSNNAKLTSVYAQNNALTTVLLPIGATLTAINLQNNQIESIDLSVVSSIKDPYLNNNKLTAVDLSKLKENSNLYLDGNQLTEVNILVTVKNLQLNNNKLTSVSLIDATASCKLENNLLTLATLPTKPAGLNTDAKVKKFTYAPQAALEVAEALNMLDLTSQLTATGILEAPATTTFSFVTASGTTLVEGTDYEVIEQGKFKFVKEQAEKVHGVLVNEGFPLFADNDAFVTTDFIIDTATDIQEVNVAGVGKVYNLQGVEVKQAQKGLYIQNGKKMIRK